MTVDKMTEAKVVATARAAVSASDGRRFDLVDFIHEQREFSLKTFGPGARTAGVIDHIRRELVEIEAAPDDVSEWIDVVILALDGALRAGHEPEQVAAALRTKLDKNKARKWPDWRGNEDKAIEHVRTEEGS